MRNSLDFSSWQSMLSTLLGLLLATLLMLGIRLVFMQTLQRKRERENRQINERLKTLIAAYKTLGSSFTGELSVDPSHLKDLHARSLGANDSDDGEAPDWDTLKIRTERRRRTRDAVEAALSDVILLGTEEQVTLAARAAQDMVEGRTVHTAALVVSLRNFIRQALDLQPIADAVPSQGPVRAASGSGGGANRRGGNAGGAAGGAGTGGKGGGGGGGMGGGAGLGMGGGMALGAGASASAHAAAAADSEPLAVDILPPDNPRI